MLIVGTTSGVYRFTRNSGSWDLVGTALDGIHISDARVDRGRPDSIVVSARKAGVYRSSDGGETWSHLLAGRDAATVAIGPAGTIFAGLRPASIYRSETGGEQWEEIPSIKQLPTFPLWNFPTPPHTGLVKSFAWSPLDERTLYGGIEVGGTIISHDGGATWAESREGLHTDVHTLIAVAKDSVDVLYAATGKGFFRSADGGGTWQGACNGMRDLYSVPVAAHPEKPDTVFTAASEGRPRYWRLRPEGAAGRIYRSTDAGEHWETAMDGLPQTLPGAVDALAVDPEAPDTVYAGSDDGRLMISRNSGEHWETIAEGLPGVRVIAAT